MQSCRCIMLLIRQEIIDMNENDRILVGEHSADVRGPLLLGGGLIEDDSYLQVLLRQARAPKIVYEYL
jgi:hypothetical protein